MAALHGGKRPGAGRPAGTRKSSAQKPEKRAPGVYDDPLSYLVAVATGAVKGEALQVAAAKAALPYTVPRARAPVESPPPAKLRAGVKDQEAVADDKAWQAKAAAVRGRFLKDAK